MSKKPNTCNASESLRNIASSKQDKDKEIMKLLMLIANDQGCETNDNMQTGSMSGGIGPASYEGQVTSSNKYSKGCADVQSLFQSTLSAADAVYCDIMNQSTAITNSDNATQTLKVRFRKMTFDGCNAKIRMNQVLNVTSQVTINISSKEISEFSSKIKEAVTTDIKQLQDKKLKNSGATNSKQTTGSLQDRLDKSFNMNVKENVTTMLNQANYNQTGEIVFDEINCSNQGSIELDITQNMLVVRLVKNVLVMTLQSAVHAMKDIELSSVISQIQKTKSEKEGVTDVLAEYAKMSLNRQLIGGLVTISGMAMLGSGQYTMIRMTEDMNPRERGLMFGGSVFGLIFVIYLIFAYVIKPFMSAPLEILKPMALFK
jgi:hypothetical protein